VALSFVTLLIRTCIFVIACESCFVSFSSLLQVLVFGVPVLCVVWIQDWMQAAILAHLALLIRVLMLVFTNAALCGNILHYLGLSCFLVQQPV
jgi:hypothetical protein